MDSLTQITLGAAVGEAVLGKQVGRKAALWGAALGTLPDLDVLANPFLTEMQALGWHRSFSHSILFVLLASPLIGWALGRLHEDAPKRRWAGMAALALGTHVVLDVCTTYGTQVFWPFSDYPLIVGSIFIIDPLYTVPLLLGLLISFRWEPTARARRWANYTGLALSSAYLLLTIGNKIWVEHVFDTATTQQDIPAEQIFTKPSAFNNLLWTGVAEVDDGFYIGLYSLLDDDTQIQFRFVPKNHHLLGDAASTEAVQTLEWFSRGYYAVTEGSGGQLLVHDLRFPRSDLGLTDSGQYIFTFDLTRDAGGRIVGFTRDEPSVRNSQKLLRLLVERIKGNRSIPNADAGPASPRTSVPAGSSN